MSVASIKSVLNTTVNFLNQPLVKEGVKNVASVATFAFGLIGSWKAYQILRGRAISTEVDVHAPQWIQTVQKMIVLCSNFSLILSGATSRPGVAIISKIVGSIWTTAQLERVFGPNTIYAINPGHPRHVASRVAVLCALPALLQTTYLATYWMYKKVTRLPEAPVPVDQNIHWLTDAKVRLMILFNIWTSRPILHLGNQFSQFLLRH